MPGSGWAWLSSAFKIFADSSCTGFHHPLVTALHDGRGRREIQPLHAPSRRLPPHLARRRGDAPSSGAWGCALAPQGTGTTENGGASSRARRRAATNVSFRSSKLQPKSKPGPRGRLTRSLAVGSRTRYAMDGNHAPERRTVPGHPPQKRAYRPADGAHAKYSAPRNRHLDTWHD